MPVREGIGTAKASKSKRPGNNSSRAESTTSGVQKSATKKRNTRNPRTPMREGSDSIASGPQAGTSTAESTLAATSTDTCTEATGSSTAQANTLEAASPSHAETLVFGPSNSTDAQTSRTRSVHNVPDEQTVLAHRDTVTYSPQRVPRRTQRVPHTSAITSITETVPNPVASPPGSSSSSHAPPSGEPPSYEESVNHLTLEYGGYFMPYEAHPIRTAHASVPSLSYSQMNLGRAIGRGRGSRNIVGPAPRNDRHIEYNPHHRGNRRIGDLAITSSDRVVMTEQVIQDLEEAEDDESKEKCTKLLLPPMHICMATTCLVFNCVIPGSGTLVAAFGLFCFTKPSEWSCARKTASSCLSLLIALAQLILTPVLLIGWIWSILWGFAYVGVSHQEYHGVKDTQEDEEDNLTTIATSGGRHRTELEDDNPPWSLGYQRFNDHPGSAPSRRRMSLANVLSGSELDAARRQASMLRATRSYGYVEVHGTHSADQHRSSQSRLQQQHNPAGSVGNSSSILNNNARPLSQMTLTSYINDGMFLNNNTNPTTEAAALANTSMADVDGM